MSHFTPLSSLFGGVIIGVASLLYLQTNRGICGISSIFKECLTLNGFSTRFFAKSAFILGLISGGAAIAFFHPASMEFSFERPLWLLLLAGFLVGYGTALSNGCTSGHGVCGVGRVSPRSLLATLLFLAIGIATASLYPLLFSK